MSLSYKQSQEATMVIRYIKTEQSNCGERRNEVMKKQIILCQSKMVTYP